MIRIVAATRQTVDYIAHRLRNLDYIELAATSVVDDPAPLLADRVMSYSAMAFVALANGEPASCWGLIPSWPGVGTAYAFGTDRWGEVLLPMTKHVSRFMLPLLLDNGYHRIEARSLASRADTRRWLMMFGAEPEAVLRSSGKRGEDFILYVWLRDEHASATHQHSRTASSADPLCHARRH